MSSKSLIWIGMVIGSVIGGIVPKLWGANAFSMSAIATSAVGGLAGIWAGYRLSRM
jgi:uncharacterized protein YcfJ